MTENIPKSPVLMFHCAPPEELDRYYSVVQPLSATGSVDVLALETSLPSEDTLLLGAHFLIIPGQWENITAKKLHRLGIDSRCYEMVAIPCSGDPAVPYDPIVELAVNLTTKKIVLVFNNLAREVVEASEIRGDIWDTRSEVKRKLYRALEYGSTEVHTSYICIHPYYGYVCRPNAVVDFGIPVPPEFGHGTTIETDRNGFRNASLPRKKPEDEYWVGLFGGSVAFSISSSNNSNTIAGYLERKLQELSPSKKIRVINLALPGGQQPQQLIIFINHHDVLDGIITFDGFNEVMVPILSSGKVPEHFPFFDYYPILFGRPNQDKQIALAWFLAYLEEKAARVPKLFRSISSYFIDRLRGTVKRSLNKIAIDSRASFVSFFDQGLTESFDEVMERGARRWAKSILMMRDIAVVRDIETLFVLQPIPDIGKPLSPLELRLLENGKCTREQRLGGLEHLWRYFEKLKQTGVNCEDFTRVFEGIHEDIYADDAHFDDRGCEIVASEIARSVYRSWKLFNGE